jgi:hypothetical protein
MLWRRLRCEVHGPLRYRRDGVTDQETGRPGEGWVCAGWDGERCLNLPDGLSETAAVRLREHQSRWPGIVVEEKDFDDTRLR